jgi:hypothetical protein
MNDVWNSSHDVLPWLTLALVNAGLAETKHRSRLRWFFLSLFIGPIATALIVVWPKSTAPAKPKLHPFSSAKDRFLLLATSAMVVFVLAVVGTIALVHDGAGTGVLLSGILVAVVAALGFALAGRGYNAHAEVQRAEP